jgi:UDP-N-acetylglucosamine 4-epimerase
VENCVQANIKAALVQNPEAVNQVYNIAVADRTSLNDLFNILKEEAGSDINPEYGPDRAGDIRDSLADISKARNLLGYDPQIRIREGLQKTLAWFEANQAFIAERN